MIAGNSQIIDWLRQRGRPFLFSSATPPADVAACIAAVDILENSTELVDRLWENAKYFKAKMKDLGFDTGVQHHAHHSCHAGRSSPGAAVQPRVVRGKCVCHAAWVSPQSRRAKPASG